MGYFEIHCILCAVSFNIARIRTIDESEDAAWSTGGTDGESWVDAFDDRFDTCSTESTGCVYVLREDGGIRYSLSSRTRHDNFNIAFEGYDSDRRLTRGQQLPIAPRLKQLPHRGCVIPSANLEHVAGPGCQSVSGYLGTKISAKEMAGCHTVQCLLAKAADPDWKHEPDDHEIETNSDYFLTGISDYMPELSSGGPTVMPARHGYSHIDSGDSFNGVEEDQGAPFHPYCLGLFLQLSHRRLGHVPLNELMNIFNRSISEATYYDETDPVVAECNKQWWSYNEGSEWVVANPFYIPRLRSILESAMDTSPPFTPQTSAFSASGISPQGSIPDLFSKLPQELRNMILHDLGSSDIACLRRASRTFYHIPVSVWHRLIQEDMPWLFEVWSDEPPYFWATVTEQDIQRAKVTIPEICQYTGEKKITGHTINVAQRVKEWSLAKPPAPTTNWFMIYRDVKREINGIRGLRNRKRIWTFLDKIIDDLIRNKTCREAD